MNLTDIIILAAILLLASAVIISKIRKVKKKGFGCDCSCTSCSNTGCSKKKNR